MRRILTDSARRALREPSALRRGNSPVVYDSASASSALQSCLQRGVTHNIFIHGAAAVPTPLLSSLPEALSASGATARTLHLHMEQGNPLVGHKTIDDTSFFISDGDTRRAVNAGTASFIPAALSDIPRLFRSGQIPIDVALLSLTPPDQHGLCSVGPSCDISRAAAQAAARIVAVISPLWPRTEGETNLHYSQLDAVLMASDFVPHSPPVRAPKAAELAIGRLIAEELICNEATLQLGIGGLADAITEGILTCGHKDLAIHTELLSDGCLRLMEAGIVTGRHKTTDAGKVVATFAVGCPDLYRALHEHAGILFHSACRSNDTRVIREQHRMTAINGALEVDLSGQICADSLGTAMFSGPGGQPDFMRGAGLCADGVAITALCSETTKGASRIVATLQSGGGIVTPRTAAHFVVTEWGIADLRGKTLHERARALIAIASPAHREALARAAGARGLL